MPKKENFRYVKLPNNEEPVSMIVFKGQLFIATKYGVYRKMTGRDIFVPIVFQVSDHD